MLHSLSSTVSRTMSKYALVGLLLMPVVLQAQTSSQEEVPAAGAAEQAQAPAGTLVYKSVNKDGQTVFTDMPPLDRPSDAVTVKPSNTMSVPRSSGGGEGSEGSAVVVDQVYTSLTVTSPQNEAFFGQEVQSITLSATAQPGMQDGHTAQLYYDGKPVGDSSLFYTIDIPDRGTHTVVAKVFNARGKLMIESDPVRFYVRRTSLLNQPNKQSANDGDDAGAPTTPPAGFGGAKGFGGAGGAGGGAAAGGAGGAGSASGAGGAGGTAATPGR